MGPHRSLGTLCCHPHPSTPPLPTQTLQTLCWGGLLGTCLPTRSCSHSVPRRLGMPRGRASYPTRTRLPGPRPSTAAIPRSEGHR